MKNHDGWTIKASWLDSSDTFLLPQFFHKTRSEVIKDFEKSKYARWKDLSVKIVKVREMTEVK